MSHLEHLESEAIHNVREAVAEARNPMMPFPAGKDSTVMGHVALLAFCDRPALALGQDVGKQLISVCVRDIGMLIFARR